MSGLLIFDCDGVLADSETIASRVPSEHSADLGVRFGAEEAGARFTGKRISAAVEFARAAPGERFPTDVLESLRAKDRRASGARHRTAAMTGARET